MHIYVTKLKHHLVQIMACCLFENQAITWTNASLVSIGEIGEISIKIQQFSFNEVHLIISAAKLLPFCLGLNVLTHWGRDKMAAIFQTTFSNAFSWMTMYKFRLNFTEVCSQGSNYQHSSMVQIIMFWHWPGDKSFSETMMVSLLPQWVKRQNTKVSILMTLLFLDELTHWDQVTHICVTKLTIIGSNNGLVLGWHQAISWTKAGILLIGPPGTNFNEILIEIYTFSFKKMHLTMSSGKWQFANFSNIFLKRNLLDLLEINWWSNTVDACYGLVLIKHQIHYLNQCWPLSMLPYDVTRPQWFNDRAIRPWQPASNYETLVNFSVSVDILHPWGFCF